MSTRSSSPGSGTGRQHRQRLQASLSRQTSRREETGQSFFRKGRGMRSEKLQYFFCNKEGKVPPNNRQSQCPLHLRRVRMPQYPLSELEGRYSKNRDFQGYHCIESRSGSSHLKPERGLRAQTLYGLLRGEADASHTPGQLPPPLPGKFRPAILASRAPTRSEPCRAGRVL